MKLVAKSIPFRDESTYSVFHRVAIANGYITTSAFLSAHTGVSTINTAVGMHDCFVSASSKSAARTFDKDFVYRPTRVEKSTFKFRKVDIDRQLLRTRERYACKQCVDEGGFSFFFWDYQLVTTCIKHGQRLSSKCASCKQPFTWDETTPLGCECSGTSRKNRVSQQELALQTKLIAWIKSGAQEQIAALESVYFGLQKIFHLTGNKQAHRRLVMLSIKAISDDESFIKEMVVSLSSSQLPNRIKVYPLLSSKVEMTKNLGEKILAELSPVSLNNSIRLPGIELSTTEVASILNISHQQTTQLFKNKVLKATRKNQKGNWKVKLRAVFELLFKLHSFKRLPDKNSVSVREVARSPNYHLPLSELVLSIVKGHNQVAEFEIDRGIPGLSINTQNMTPDLVQYDEGYISLKDAAREFGHAHHHLREFASSGHLIVIKATGDANKILVHRDEMIRFNNQYLIGPEMARNASLSPKSFARKLIAYGIKPVAGPTIDDGPINLFRREDVINVDLKEVEATAIGVQPKRVGSPKNGKTQNDDLVTFNEVKKALKIDTETLRKLLKKRIIKSRRLGWKALVTRESYEAFKHKINSADYIRLEDALKQLGIEKKIFRTKFVQTGQCKIEDLYIAKVIKKSEFQHIQELHNSYMTSAEANALLTGRPSNIGNFKNQGLISPAIQLEGSRRDINLWSREEFASLVSRQR